MADKEDLIKEYKKLAKYADEKMRRLEDLSKQEGYQVATQWAYKKAEKDIAALFGDSDKLRWDKRLSKDDSRISIEAKINAVKGFLNAPTSSKRGIDTVFKARAKTLNDKYGTNFKWKDLAAFFTSGQYEKLSAKFGSEDVFMKMGKYYTKKEKQIVQSIKKAGKKHVTSNDILKEINRRMNNLKPTIQGLDKD